jgi:hypothetical protein
MVATIAVFAFAFEATFGLDSDAPALREPCVNLRGPAIDLGGRSPGPIN